MIEIKEGANIQGLDLAMRPAMVAVGEVYKEYGKTPVVTAGLDGAHSAGSLHYYGRAVDFRTRYFTEEEKQEVYAKIRNKLNRNFDIVMHSTHMHIEYDPKV